jgi:hypothetical protein
MIGRRACTFRQRDVKAAIEAVTAAGKDIAAVEIGAQGQIRIVIGNPGIQPLGQDELDRELAKFEERHGRA